MRFTNAEYTAFMHFQNVKFEYLYALHSLNDESTDSDRLNVAELRSEHVESLYSPQVQWVLSQFC